MSQPLTVLPRRQGPVDLRPAFRQAASSAWVITSSYAGQPVGFTAISVVSVSVDPPLVSFNLNLTSSSRSTIEQSGRVALHLLADGQADLARRFSADRSQRFAYDGAWRWHADELPALTDPVLRLSADVVGVLEAGDSLVVTAEVTDIERAEGVRPLVHHDADYRALD
ncbi:flavin reductase family protein [Barrientosiimonas humi]|uniref:flavin reductase family protein n=1 Tax=Barrientosiimonas humi TaxID=999931 RepID=UPI00370DB6E0